MAEQDSESEICSRARVINNDQPRGLHQKDSDQGIRYNTFNPKLSSSIHIVRSGDGLLPESHHVTHMDNYGLCAYRI